MPAPVPCGVGASELSPAATAAIRIADDLEAPRTHATESRLMSIAAQLSRLASDTDPDATRRLRQLEPLSEILDVQDAHEPRHPSELFDADEAARIFFHYFQHRTVPDGYTLRLIDDT
jgi:hypothetical protein